MNINNKNFASIESMRQQLAQQVSSKGHVSSLREESSSFQQILTSKQEESSRTQEKGELRFSKHANERLVYRNIDLSKEQVERLINGTNKAREKGIRESLVMVDDLAFIVNVKNNIVITAVNDTEDVVFTNIDGAVIS